MRGRLGIKAALIGGIVALLLVPLLMLRGLVEERQLRAAEMRADIAQSTSGAQIVTGPLLRLRVEHTAPVLRAPHDGALPEPTGELRRRLFTRVVTPDRLDIDATLATERRQRGLFEARVYQGALTLAARFAAPSLEAPTEGEALRIVDASLVLGVGDTRGIRRLAVTVDGALLESGSGSGIGWLAEGVHAPLPLQRLEAGFDVDIELALTGTEAIHWLPVGGDTRVQLAMDWPHPGFGGNRLPDAREVRDDGASAQWTVSRLASRAHALVRGCDGEAAHCAGLMDTAFGVALVDPVDRYLMTDRAMKYGLLFLVLVFGAVFLTETLAALAVHPLQYAMAGLALSTFFLLLLALAEHLGFGLSYALAAIACVALLSAYMRPALQSARRTAWFTGLLLGLYALLYGLLQSEDHALLIGALALFALLATAMLLTRRIDWYRFGGEGATV
jgi:inner membrane protein